MWKEIYFGFYMYTIIILFYHCYWSLGYLAYRLIYVIITTDVIIISRILVQSK